MRRGVTVVSGFLGSGKTTFLRGAVRAQPDTAVVINEYGEATLDHELVDIVTEAPVIVSRGCACCTRREELVQAMVQRLDLEERGRAPQTNRLIIETSGLADPAPILFTIGNDPVLRHHYVVDEVCVMVDALNGARHLDRQRESVSQVAITDRLVVTKTDLAERATVEALIERLSHINPAARIDLAAGGEVVHTWRAPLPERGSSARAPIPADNATHDAGHVADVGALSLDLDEPVSWQAFGTWLTMLLHTHGETILRVKGVFDARDMGRVTVDGVQHIVHSPQHLAAGSVAGGLVVIGRGIDVDLLRRSFVTFQRLGDG